MAPEDRPRGEETRATSLARLGRRPLPVSGTPGLDLRIDLATSGLAGRWVTLTWRDVGSGGLPRALVSAVTEAGTTALAEEAVGGDVFVWTGRLPEGTTALRFTAHVRGKPFALDGLTVRRRGRVALVLRAGWRAPGLTAQAVGWRLLRLKVRARGYLSRALAQRAETGYATWIARFDRRTPADRARIRAEIAAWEAPPLLSVLMPVFDPDPRVLDAAIRSVRGGLYPHWELCIVDDASTNPQIARLIARHAAQEPRIRTLRRPENGHIARATNDALTLATGAYCVFLDHDDLLADIALYEVARAVRAAPHLILVYSDEDKVDARDRRFEPHFKSGFDRELLQGQNYVNHLCAVRTDRLRALGGLRPGFEGSQDHDLLLRLTEAIDGSEVRHIPKLLYHWRAAAGSGTFSDRALARAEAARLRALSEVAARRGARAERGAEGFNRLVRPVPVPAPLVSVVIPTRDRAELLAVVLDGLFARTDYPAIEVIVVDNDSREAATQALFAGYAEDARLRVLPSPGPFNFSQLSNQGAAAARGSVLLFLNNDIEVLEPGWLTELVSIAVEPGIGAVGAKLLYPDGTIQHGGIVLGIGGIAGHSHLGLPGDAPGYFARMVLTQEVSAVTGACLAMRRAVFEEVGGFDAEALAVAFNDVDLCLRVGAAGYRVVWTPHARLIHHESKSRGAEDTPEKRARFEAESQVMRARWEPILRADPYYNINLSRTAAHYRL
ncbi:glycosyltransferase family 2 protein [Methylobacterium sp. Leaf118]|uniref:glycosyltransferase family 2 protein n=1 Tax=Methylobacterium sp. Leaf118 TaxID=2876562 RepID=UPI001E2DDB13|nr:glycosyltransferase family 2 protein [Methylobacterium sp. Leaf118]